MSGGPPSLATSFYSTYRGVRTAGEPDANAALDAALADFAARGRAAWPDVALDAAALAAQLGERAPADASPVNWLAAVPAADLFLACACAKGLPEAMRAFDAAFLDDMGLHLRALRPTPDLIAETKQALLERLFVGAAGKPPKILRYGGQGALGGWVRVIAVRTALTLMSAEKAGAARADDTAAIARALVPDGDPEIELMRARYLDDFVAAFREAVAALSRRDRGLLRFTFVERLTPAQIGAMYGVHRTTAMRWIDAAQGEVLSRTRVLLRQRLHLSPSECDDVFALLKSRIDVTLGSLLKTAS